MIRKALAVWHGTGREGSGTLSTESGTLSNAAYSYRTRFGPEVGTNPEELLAAAHAGCFTMAVAFRLQLAGITATRLYTDAVITIDAAGGNFRITQSALTLRGSAPKLDQASFERLAQEAAVTCPLSQVLKAEITLDARLIEGTEDLQQSGGST
jgi:osmotically inducible protein OsmC